MDPRRFDTLTRFLAGSASRRGIAHALAGLTLAGALSPLLGPFDADAKKKRRNNRKRRKRGGAPSPPFCAAKNHCVDSNGLCSRSGLDDPCFCYPTVETGAPFCGKPTNVYDCSLCASGETCLDFSECGVVAEGCATPCPDPL
jgi:hypothetical protein